MRQCHRCNQEEPISRLSLVFLNSSVPVLSCEKCKNVPGWFVPSPQIDMSLRLAWKRGKELHEQSLQMADYNLQLKRERLKRKIQPHLDRILTDLPKRIENAVAKGESSLWLVNLSPHQMNTQYTRMGEEPSSPMIATVAEALYSSFKEKGLNPQIQVKQIHSFILNCVFGKFWEVSIVINLNDLGF